MAYSETLEKLTICICVRDGERYVDRCLSSIFEDLLSSIHCLTRVLIVDHLSKDQTPALLTRWQSKWLENNLPEFTILRFEGDGLAAARNCAWQNTKTPWVGFIDIDCKVYKGWTCSVFQTIDNLNKNLELAAFGGANLVPSNGEIIYKSYTILLSTYVGGHNSILNRPVSKVLKVNHLPTLNVVYRRAFLEIVNGFDPSFVRVGEDIDLSYRLIQAGYELLSNPGMVVDHALKPSIRSWTKNMFLYGRGRCFFIKRHPNSFECKFLAPLIVFLAYFGSLILVPIKYEILLLILLIHVGLIGLAILPETLKQKARPIVWLVTIWIVVITHIAYGAGFFREIFSKKEKFAL